MKALWTGIALCAVPFFATAAPDLEAECRIQGELVQKIVDKRLEGKGKRRAERQIRRDATEEEARYDAVIAAMVDWVYLQLPEDQLGEEVGSAWDSQCLDAAKKASSG